MNVTAYSFVASERVPARAETFQLFHNGEPVAENGKHGTREAAWDRAFDLSAQLGTSLRCFRVRKVSP
jgi:hypothetical protein